MSSYPLIANIANIASTSARTSDAASKLKSQNMSASQRQASKQIFEQTLTKYRPMVSRVVSSYERIPALQEELYQEISLALWKALPKFDHKSSLKTYILSIAHKRAVSHVAKHAKDPNFVEVDESHHQHEPCPSEKMATEQQMSRLLNAIHRLTLLDRQLVILALEEMSYKEIAEILGLTVNHIGVKLNRAKSQLAQFMSREPQS